MATFIIIYSIGVLISGIGIFLYEYLYLYDKQISYISRKEIIQDVLLSLLSWLMVLGLIFSVVIDIKMGWPSRGHELNLAKKKKSIRDGLFMMPLE